MVVGGVVAIAADPSLLSDWTSVLTHSSGGPLAVLGTAVLAFPLLVLGLSGFETGVSMMPLVARGETDTERLAAGSGRPAGCSPSPPW